MEDFEKKDENLSGGFPINEFATQGQFPKFEHGTTFEDIQQRIEASKSNGWGAQIGNFIATNKKRVFMLAAIIALFAFSSYLSNRSAENEEGEANEVNVAGISESAGGLTQNEPGESGATLPNEASGFEIKLGEDGKVVSAEAPEEKTKQEESGSLISQINEKLAQAETNESGEESTPEGVVTKTAKAGEGITHLARSALRDYLNDTGKTLSTEQKVYAEDYAQNKTGSEPLEVGQQLSFDKDLLNEAVERAEALTEAQIQNLKQYTTGISLL